jgi:heat shock protein HtpX
MWEQIRSNRIRSFWVVSLLGLLLVVSGLALGAVFVGQNGWLIGGGIALTLWFFLWMTSITSGDNLLLNIAGAKELNQGELSQLRNVVEEMSIAAALPQTPRVFLVDDPSPNAFAVGRDPKKAAVAVTTGLLAVLSRDELQGVVAHEIGHIKNRDVALMTTAGIMLGVIVLISDMAMRGLWWGGGRRSRSSSQSGGGGGAALLVGLLVLILAPILAQLLYFSLSRRREYLADACGARYSRYPEGLASALEKIGGLHKPQADQSSVTAPMYLVRPLKAGAKRKTRSASSIFATHPPLEKRIGILRAMGGGADFASYDQAYRQVSGKSVIGARSLVGDQAGGGGVIPVRSANPQNESAHDKARQASDAFLSASDFQKVHCRRCGAIIKVPTSMRAKLEQCPRCEYPLNL